MNHNPAIQNVPSRAWDGAVAYPADMSEFVYHAFSFEVMVDLAADAVFKVQAAPASAGNPCVPGAFADLDAIATCAGETIAPGTDETIVIAAGTEAGTLCSAAIPCRQKFVRLASVSGPTDDVFAFHLRSGPKGP